MAIAPATSRVRIVSPHPEGALLRCEDDVVFFMTLSDKGGSVMVILVCRECVYFLLCRLLITITNRLQGLPAQDSLSLLFSCIQMIE